jgi:FKBP-type peptidyl-prolyl cis-trans isomerase
MKNKIFTLSIVLLILSACTLEGVKEKKKADTTNTETETIDSIEIEPIDVDTLHLKKDTLENGQANDMVWNGEKGLRIEWDIKSDKPQLKYGDVVMVNYTARVARGEVFDSNSEIGQPIPLKIGIGQLIDGWEKGMLQLHEDDKGRILIPAKLAYGETGLGNIVPINADIIVDIEIIKQIQPFELEEGVKVYKYESVDEGEYPTKNQMITFNYFAFRSNNKPGLYDNSYEKGKPFTFRFQNDNLIDGLHIGFAKLKAGEKAFIDIPAEAAYGKAGIVDLVPKNTNIVYDVRVEKIE